MNVKWRLEEACGSGSKLVCVWVNERFDYNVQNTHDRGICLRLDSWYPEFCNNIKQIMIFFLYAYYFWGVELTTNKRVSLVLLTNLLCRSKHCFILPVIKRKNSVWGIPTCTPWADSSFPPRRSCRLRACGWDASPCRATPSAARFWGCGPEAVRSPLSVSSSPGQGQPSSSPQRNTKTHAAQLRRGSVETCVKLQSLVSSQIL